MQALEYFLFFLFFFLSFSFFFFLYGAGGSGLCALCGRGRDRGRSSKLGGAVAGSSQRGQGKAGAGPTQGQLLFWEGIERTFADCGGRGLKRVLGCELREPSSAFQGRLGQGQVATSLLIVLHFLCDLEQDSGRLEAPVSTSVKWEPSGPPVLRRRLT